MSFTLTVLGAATPYPRPDAACSGYLLRAGEAQIWVDAGPGTLANLQRHTSPERLTAIWLSHVHADHSADLLGAYYTLAYADLTPAKPIPVYGPPGWAARLEAFLTVTAPNPMSQVFEVHELHDGHQAEFGELRLTSVAVQHDAPGFGLRAEYADRVFAYSGDTGPCTGLDLLAAGADLLLCEADATSWPAGEPQWHCTPEDAGTCARRAKVGCLVVTHVGPTLTGREAIRRAAAAFGGTTALARDGGTHTI